MNPKLEYTIVGISVLALIALLVFSNQTGNVIKETKKTIKIGAVYPLSGSVGFLGLASQQAIELAQSQLPNNTKYNYEVIFEDSKLDPKEAAIAANKLVNIDNVDALISFTSGIGNVLAPIAQENKILHIGIASDANIAKTGNFNFLDWTSPAEENRVMVKELQNRGIKRLAVIELNQQGTKAIADELKLRLNNTNINIVSDEVFNFGDTDFKTILLKVKQSNPDIILLLAVSPEIELLAKQIKELGISTPLTSIETFEYSEQPQLFEGDWYVQAADPTSDFTNTFKQKYGKIPIAGSPNSYDSFNLIVQAFENAKSPTATDAAAELPNIKDYNGALGKLNVLSTRIIDSNAVVRKIVNGTPVTISSSN